VLELADSWVWDFWVADTGDDYHLFFLFASRALGDPQRRHRRASVGHAVSTDLRSWRRVADALVRSDAPAIDDVATWTGSVVRDDHGVWRMFFTGLSDDPVLDTQVVASARSGDLFTWQRDDTLVRADPRFYAVGERDGVEPFRDPWVERDADGLWHLLITASAPGADRFDEAVLGHATSPDLETWRVSEPLVGPGTGFGQLEVPSIVRLGDETLLLFNCLDDELSERRRAQSPTGGVWFAPAGGVAGPFDLEAALPLTDDTRYVGRAVVERDGQTVLLAFENTVDGRFVGRLADPVPLIPLVERARARARDQAGSAPHASI
jgi:beta-fructofuranosidase